MEKPYIRLWFSKIDELDFCQMLEDREKKSGASKDRTCLDPYFSGTKAKWLTRSCPHARERAQKGKFTGTIDTAYLELCGAHVTDPSMHREPCSTT